MCPILSFCAWLAFWAGPRARSSECRDQTAFPATGGLDVEGVFADLLDRGDAGERQKKAEVVGEISIGAGDGFALDEVFGFKRFAVGGQDELGLLAGGGGARPQRREGGRHFAFRADLDVDVIALQHPAGQIGLVRVSGLQTLERGLLVAERFQEGKGESAGVKRSLREL